MAATNGRKPTLPLDEIIANILSARQEWLSRLASPRSNVDEECGYPASPSVQDYKDLYDRNAIAERVVQLMPRESWQITPQVYEEEDAETRTPFEQAWDNLGTALAPHGQSWYQDEEGSLVWSYLLRADILSGIGSFGLLLLGLNDGGRLSDPAPGAPTDGNPGTGDSTLGTEAQYQWAQLSGSRKAPPTGERKLLYLRCFDESLVQISRYESNPGHPRYGQPVMYTIILNDPQTHAGQGLATSTVSVHWSRVIHLADNGDQSSEIFAKPRLEPVVNNVLDLKKLHGGSAAMYWYGAFPGLSFETDPQLGGDVDFSQQSVREMGADYLAGLQRLLVLNGFAAKSLAPQVVDPSQQIAVQIEAICICIGCPVRIFKGSERGELSSTQDEGAWNDRLRSRQKFYLTPRVICPFIDRLILLGVLPPPKGYSVAWPDIDALSDKDKAEVAFKKTQALAQYVGSGVDTLIPPLDYLTRVQGMDEEEAQAILDNAEAQQANGPDGLEDDGPAGAAVPNPANPRGGSGGVRPPGATGGQP